MTTGKDKLYQDALEAWGPEMQSLMLAEEVGELLQAWSKYRRGEGLALDVVNEIADVQIMLEQVEIMLAQDCGGNVTGIRAGVASSKALKLRRLGDIIRALHEVEG